MPFLRRATDRNSINDWGEHSKGHFPGFSSLQPTQLIMINSCFEPDIQSNMSRTTSHLLRFLHAEPASIPNTHRDAKPLCTTDGAPLGDVDPFRTRCSRHRMGALFVPVRSSFGSKSYQFASYISIYRPLDVHSRNRILGGYRRI